MDRRDALAAVLLCAACSAYNGSLEIAVAGNGTTEPPPGRYEHPIGSAISVTARPASGAAFVGWSGAASSAAPTVSVVVHGQATLVAQFRDARDGSSSGGGQGSSGGGQGSSGGGQSSSGGGQSSSGGPDPATLREAAAVLDGFAILKPCNGWSFSYQNNAGDCCCEEVAASENQHIVKQFGGDPSVTYLVKVRIAGVAERYWYSGGALDQASGVFYTGGLPTIHSPAAPNDNLRPGQGACKIHPPETDSQFRLPFSVPSEIRPSDGCYDGFNIFAMTVSSPKQSYYLNETTDFDGADRQPHSVYRIDYTVTIPISGQATLDFYAIDGDHHQVTNNGTMSVPAVKTAQPYNGNFLELTVEDVTTR